MPSCLHCLAGKKTVEIAGLRFHTLADRWISCNAPDEQQVMVPPPREFIGRLQTAFPSISLSSFGRLRRRVYTRENS